MFDKIIIGAGLYGLYAALHSGKKGESILVIELENDAFQRATYINQARVHNGYHYPRSYSTAKKSINYFQRFNNDYSSCINNSFKQIYATSAKFSWTNSKQFKKFSESAGIKCEEFNQSTIFNEGMCDGAFLTEEYAYDAQILKEHLITEIRRYPNIEIKFNTEITSITKVEDYYAIETNNGLFQTGFLINATYASTNQIIKMLGFEPLKIKYELCEIILCSVSKNISDVGITVMDGPFFSLMPFGKTGYHSLTSVTFTPHASSFDTLPVFDCQKNSNGYCSPNKLGNCNKCIAKPTSAWPYMSNLAKKYLKDDIKFEYIESLYSMKPILRASEIDDSRPTVIKKFNNNPTFISVLSGKINTLYDLDGVLDGND